MTIRGDDDGVDPQQHEQECLAAAREELAGVDRPELIHDIRLEGTYPDTRLIVDVSRPRGGRIELPWRLWGGREDFGELEDLESVSPEIVGSDVWLQVYEYTNT